MSADLFDLGARLAAGRAGAVMPRISAAPVAGLVDPIMVSATTGSAGVTVTAADAQHRSVTASNTDAVRVLGDLGADLSAATPRTLVVPDAGSVAALDTLARRCCRVGDSSDDVGAQLAYWTQRADFPGGQAVLNLIGACRTRWVTGTTPSQERRLGTWAEWLHLPVTDLAGLAARVADGNPLPMLDVLADDDRWAYAAAQRDHSNGWDWRRSDTPARAAVGLKGRCDAADVFAAALLGDPLWRQRAVHTGHVVCGVATPQPGRGSVFVASCDRLDARLRVGAAITGWVGEPADDVRVTFRGTITTATVAGGQLQLTVTGARMGAPGAGQRITMHPTPPSVGTLRAGRSRFAGLYAAKRSWLTTGRTPTPTRRDTPFDVLVAAAQ